MFENMVWRANESGYIKKKKKKLGWPHVIIEQVPHSLPKSLKRAHVELKKARISSG